MCFQVFAFQFVEKAVTLLFILEQVQRLIAGSPHILLEDNFNLGKPSVKISPLKKLRSEYVSEPTAPPIVKAKDNYPRSIPITEYADQNAVRKFPLPSVNYDTSKGLNTEELNFWALFCKSFFSSWEYLYETSPMVFPTTTSKD